MKVLITGGTGQLGTEVTQYVKSKEADVYSFGSKKLNILERHMVEEIIQEIKPDVIFHCAAYTAVDDAEDIGKETNWEVNVEGTRHVAEAARKHNATLVYISTDYVFDGSFKGEYKEEHETNPKNEYGRAKLAGEKVIQEVMSKNYYIIRTSWVFGEHGHNFVYTMKRLAEEHETLTVVNDQIGRPTCTRSIAEFIWYLVNTKQEEGLYHFSNAGQCTWFEFAKEILKNKSVEIKPVTSKEFPQKAYRPRHSVMSLEKAKSTGFNIIHWKDALSSIN